MGATVGGDPVSMVAVRARDDCADLPPGFRFYPTDEEIISHYLFPKVVDCRFTARAIGEVDLNKSEPWELPSKAKMGEKEFYFFCHRDRKYPTGTRTNRATGSGYWKATGKDKEIYAVNSINILVGMKKTLVFYKGRAPKGSKTNWVMHEYRLEGKGSYWKLPNSAKDDWVVCRIFHKTSGIKRGLTSETLQANSSQGYEHSSSSMEAPILQALIMESPCYLNCTSGGLDLIGGGLPNCTSSNMAMSRTFPITNNNHLLNPYSMAPPDSSSIIYHSQQAPLPNQSVPNLSLNQNRNSSTGDERYGAIGEQTAFQQRMEIKCKTDQYPSKPDVIGLVPPADTAEMDLRNMCTFQNQ